METTKKTYQTVSSINNEYKAKTGAKYTPSLNYLKNTKATLNGRTQRAAAQIDYNKAVKKNKRKFNEMQNAYNKQKFKMHYLAEIPKNENQSKKLLKKYVSQTKKGLTNKLAFGCANYANSEYVSGLRNFSPTKQKQLADCEKLCKKLKGKNFTITSVSSAMFECAFMLENITQEKLKTAGVKVSKDFQPRKKNLFYLQQHHTYII